MKSVLILPTALVTMGHVACADVVMMSWGVAFGKSQTEADVKPFFE